MNRGDTVTLMLNYQINGEPLVKDAYEEMELQINKDSSQRAMRKTLSGGDIKWETLTFYNEGVEETFEGYTVHLSQSESFTLVSGQSQVQLRIKKNGEVGSSSQSNFVLGDSLSTQIL